MILGSIIIFYVGVYSVLSMNGIFRPGCIGTNGIKWYEWTPYGFVNENYEYNHAMMAIYMPLIQLDCRFWHTDDLLYRSWEFDPYLNFRGKIIDGRDAFDARKRYKEQQKLKP